MPLYEQMVTMENIIIEQQRVRMNFKFHILRTESCLSGTDIELGLIDFMSCQQCNNYNIFEKKKKRFHGQEHINYYVAVITD